MGATLSSETTAAATGAVGVVRRDPFAMLPFIGYHVGDYIAHWLKMGKGSNADKMPKVFYVNWFRRSEDGGFLWPGFGENLRVLKWALERINGEVDAVETPLGFVPNVANFVVNSDQTSDAVLKAALNVDRDEWKQEIPLINEWFETIGKKLPVEMKQQLELLKSKLT
jgi:phosphoenolpyruvate carboxykinase (GTP)